MRQRDSAPSGILGFAELLVVPLDDTHRRRPAEPSVLAIYSRQQRDVLLVVLHRKGRRRYGAAFTIPSARH